MDLCVSVDWVLGVEEMGTGMSRLSAETAEETALLAIVVDFWFRSVLDVI